MHSEYCLKRFKRFKDLAKGIQEELIDSKFINSFIICWVAKTKAETDAAHNPTIVKADKSSPLAALSLDV